MDAISYFIIAGILSSVFVFGLKTGIGCGFSNTSWKTVFGLCALYLIISVISGYIMDMVDVQGFLSSSLAAAIHVVLALFLIFGGISTIKKWNDGCDISNKTFLILVLPCPVCLAALMVSAAALSTVIDTRGEIVGLIVGIVFVFSILISSLFFKNLGKICEKLNLSFRGTPETLGSVMIFIGLFYLIAAILIPAYMQAGEMPQLVSNTISQGELFSYFVAFLLIMVGIVASYLADRN
ncbi:MAG: DUF2162 domain-containing protein [Methanosarcinaceae archaeon]|nr:DUF2162 domain-containing protein [Methanosarcinaceae archaeon]